MGLFPPCPGWVELERFPGRPRLRLRFWRAATAYVGFALETVFPAAPDVAKRVTSAEFPPVVETDLKESTEDVSPLTAADSEGLLILML